MGLGLGSLFGMASMLGGQGGVSKDNFFANTGVVNKSDKPEASKGTTNLTSIKGDRDTTKSGETYVEIKGPTMVGTRSSVAYTKDGLNAKKKAEQAIDRQKIPKEHEKRVKEYFNP